MSFWNTQWGSGSGLVASVFGRIGIVASQVGDYLASQITNDSGVTGATVKDALNTLASAIKFLMPQSPDLDCSANPNYPAATQWMCWFVSVAGKIGGASGKVVEAGDMVICKITNVGGTEAAVGADWTVLQVNILSTPLYAANNLSDLANAATARGNLGVSSNLRQVEFRIDGGGYPVLAGVITPFKAVQYTISSITGWKIRATDSNGNDVSDACAVDVLASTTYDGAMASIIGAGNKPTLAAQAANAAAVSGWTATALTRGGWVTVQVTSAPTTATCIIVQLDTVIA